MQSIINFFGANGFIPHGYCLTWSSGLLWLHVLSDALIVLAYYSIPLTLAYFVRQRKDLPYPWLFAMFGLFIVACGTTHLLSVITIWIPLYWLDGIVKAVTAIVSVAAALMMFWVTPRALLLRSPAQLEMEVRERKRTEAALQQSQKELQDAQRIAHVGSWRLDVATNHVDWSEELYRIWGLSQELPPPDYHEHRKFLTPESWERLDAVLPHTRETGIPYEVELEIVRVDGSHRWILARGEAIRDASGAIVTLQGVAMDITERRQAEDALRESEANLSAMLDNLPYLTWLKDSGGRYIKINKVFADYLHLENPQQAIGKTDLDLQPKELAEKYRADDAEVMAAKKSKHVEESAFDGKNTHWVETYKTPIIDPHGNVLGTAGFASDITERKRVEQSLRDADQRKDEFLAMLAHELRNPLVPIRNAAHIIGRLGLNEPRIEWSLELINRQVNHLTRLVDDLLDVSRIAQGKIQLDLGEIELAALVGQLMQSIRPLAESKGHQLAVRLPDQPVWLQGDTVRLSQMLFNLMDNAIKYTPDGGRIEFAARLVGQEIEISVRDNGMGIRAELLPRVFDLFQQDERKLDRAQGGLGIGLTLVQRLVGMHGGRVAAYSEGKGLGATFTVWLPAMSAPPAVHDEEAKSSAASGVRVLVVDDDYHVSESTATLLELEGHTVRVADSGLAALEQIPAFRPQVVLLDIGLKGMDGFETAKRLRELPGGRDLFLVAVTGYGDEQTRMQAMASGCDYFVVKPVTFDVLGNLLAKAV